MFGFRGRIGRKSFMLGIGLVIAVQAALLSHFIGQQEGSGAQGIAALAFFGMGVFSVWASLALAVKRLHDLSLPGALSLIAFFPGIAWIGFILLAALPGKAETNEHGPPPFPRPGDR